MAKEIIEKEPLKQLKVLVLANSNWYRNEIETISNRAVPLELRAVDVVRNERTLARYLRKYEYDVVITSLDNLPDRLSSFGYKHISVSNPENFEDAFKLESYLENLVKKNYPINLNPVES